MNSSQISILIILHILICLSYFVLNIRFRGLQDSFYKLAVIFFLPAAGILFFIISEIFTAVRTKSDSMVDSYLKYIKEHKHIYYEEDIDFEKEINIIPMTDSLEFSDNKSKRAYLIYILKKDFLRHIKGLQKAIKSRDTETSHYAASALMEIKKQFEVIIANASEKYEHDKENVSAVEEYANTLKKYLKSGLPDKIDYDSCLQKYSVILAELLLKNKTNELYFTEKINCDIELLDSESALQYCDIFFSNFPNSEKPYLSLLKLYYMSGEEELFKKVLRNFKKRKTDITDYSESIIKFWEDQRSDVC
ncbi:MAG: hypothetical protein M1308_21925 [Actinobacteria bacterium]|nr:hypothetical protein [Actinomycetota bacterium]